MSASALAVAAVLVVLPLVPSSASAATNGEQVLCSKADYSCLDGTGYHGQSFWGANYGKTGHNCTSYVSYLLATEGVAEPWHVMGNANTWDDHAMGKVRVDDVPAAGAVAQWEGHTAYVQGPSGHVAFVDSVTPSSITISEDNFSGGTRRLRIDRGSAYWPSHFVHIHDLAPMPHLSDAAFALTNEQNQLLGTAPVTFGTAGDVPVAGDWNGDGKTTLGVFHDGTWTLSNGKAGSKLRTNTVHFGRAGDWPVVGNWNGDGVDHIGVFRDGEWALSTPTMHDPDHMTMLHFGSAGDTPVVGDWDGIDGDTIGVFRDGVWTLSNDLYGGVARRTKFRFGGPGDQPVTGNWDGGRGTGIGVYRSGNWSLSNTPTASLVDLVHLQLGGPGQFPLIGSWDGQGRDTVALAS